MKTYSSIDGAGYIQFSDGTEVFPLGECFNADALPDPQMDSDPVQCFDENRQPKVVGETVTMPGKVTTTLTGLVESVASYLERVKEAKCRFNLFITQSKCSKKGVFSGWDRAWVYRQARITDNPVTNTMHRDTDTPTESAFNITAWPGRVDHRTLTASRIATVETAALNGIAACSDQCAGECGPYIELCQNLWAAADTVAAGIPDVLRSINRGANWTSPASGHLATESVMAIACIQIKDATRIVTVRDSVAGNPLHVCYADVVAGVLGAWTTVVVGATVAEAAVGGSSMFFLDAKHGWLCTDDGRVFFTSDSAASWTDQTTALAASGANALNAIHFIDANTGVAVGAADTIIVTVDGGANWAVGTATGSGDALNAVHVFDSQRLIVGTDSGASANPLYMSYDWTTNWTTIDEGLNAAATDTIEDVAFLPDGLTGFLIKNTAAPLGAVHKSIDGGRSWRAITTPANSGLNSLNVCSANLALAVGEINAATSTIIQISG